MVRLTPALTSRKILNISYAAPQETLLAVPETLPTAEPSVPQIGYTVETADLPAFNMGVYRKIFVAMVFGAGKATTAGTVYWRMKKNGVSVATGSGAVAANTFFTFNAYFYNVGVDDLLELALWSNRTDTVWDYKAYNVQVSRLILINKPRLLCPCNFTSVGSGPVLTLGSPAVSGVGPIRVYHLDVILPTITSATNYEIIYPKDSFGMFRIYYGDASTSNSGTLLTSSTSRPMHYRNYFPLQIVMRGLRGVVEP